MTLLALAVLAVIVVSGQRGSGPLTGVLGDGDATARDDVEVVLPEPSGEPTGRPTEATDDPIHIPPVTPTPAEHATVTCVTAPGCERFQLPAALAPGLDLAVVAGLVITSDGAGLIATAPDGQRWTLDPTDLLVPATNDPDPDDPDPDDPDPDDPEPNGRQPPRVTSFAAAGSRLAVTTDLGGLALLEADGAVVAVRGGLAEDLGLDQPRLTGATDLGDRVLLAFEATIPPSVGQAEFAERSRTARQVVAVDAGDLAIVDRSSQQPWAQLIGGIPVLSGGPDGEAGLDPNDLSTPLWREPDRRPGERAFAFMDHVLTIGNQSLELRIPATGQPTLQFDGSDWTGTNLDELGIIVGTAPDAPRRRVWATTVDGRIRWQRDLADGCCRTVGSGPAPGTVQVVGADTSSTVLDAANGAVLLSGDAVSQGRPVGVSHGVVLVQFGGRTQLFGPDGTELAVIEDRAFPIELPGTFAVADHRTITVRTDGAVIQLAFPR